MISLVLCIAPTKCSWYNCIKWRKKNISKFKFKFNSQSYILIFCWKHSLNFNCGKCIYCFKQLTFIHKFNFSGLLYVSMHNFGVLNKAYNVMNSLTLVCEMLIIYFEELLQCHVVPFSLSQHLNSNHSQWGL